MKKIFAIIILVSVFIYCEKIEFKTGETMAQQDLNIGSSYDDPSADSARTAFDKIQDNFDELYASTIALEALNTSSEVTVILPIGVWNMDTGSDNTITWNKPVGAMITDIQTIIIADDGVTQRPITHPISGTGLPGGYALYDSGEAGIYIERMPGSIFDGVAYDGSSNRGYVRVSYIIP